MKIADENTLEELEKILNDIANKINQERTAPIPALAAQMLYPEIFVKPRDDYMNIMLKEILEGLQANPDEDQDENVVAYVGNIHVAPLARIWNTKAHEKGKSSTPQPEGGRKLRSTRVES